MIFIKNMAYSEINPHTFPRDIRPRGKDDTALTLRQDHRVFEKGVGINRPPLNYALLTSGSGPIALQTFEILKKQSRLKCVVFSNKRRKVSKIKRALEYGLWYVFQNIVSKVSYLLKDYSVTQKKLLVSRVKFKEWRSKNEQNEIIKFLKQNEVKIIFICGFQHILSNDFLNEFDYKINIHPSLLPLYRGPEPIIWGLLKNEKEFGITAHLVDSGIDTGDIIFQYATNRPLLPLFILVEIALSKKINKMILEVLRQIDMGSINAKKQTGGFYLPPPTLSNRKVNIFK